MAVVVGGLWELPSSRGQRAGEVITVGRHGELQTLIEQYNRAFSHGVATQAGALLKKNNGGFPLTASYARIGFGRKRIWGKLTRWAVSAYGAQFNVRLTIGGVVVATVTRSSAVQGWQTSAIGAGTAGITMDADGFADFELEASYTASPGESLLYVCIEEHFPSLGNLPGYAGANAATDWHKLDSEIDEPDLPLDRWMLQALDDNIKRCQYWIGCSGQMHLYPWQAGHRHILSSVHWRCDGPYIVTPHPWATHARVAITAVSDAEGAELFVFSEAEDPNAVMSDRKVTWGAVVKTEVFENIAINRDRLSKNARSTPTRIWIAFKSDVDYITPVVTGIEIGEQSTSDKSKLYVEDDATFLNEQPMPFGVCGATGIDEYLIHDSGKGSLGASQPTSFFDIANIKVAANISPGTHVPIQISPHPDTGKSDIAEFQPYLDGATTVYQALFDLHDIGEVYLYSVYIETLPDEPTRDKLAQAGDRPSSGLMIDITERMSELISQSTPSCYIRTMGHKYFQDDTTTGAPDITDITREGKYIFLSGLTTASGTAQIPVPVTTDPNQGETGGLLCKKLYAQIDCILVHNYNITNVERGQLGLRLRISGGAAGTEVKWGQVIEERRPTINRSVTITDAAAAARAINLIINTPGNDDEVEYAYTQQYTWLTEARAGSTPWRMSPVVEFDESSITYPSLMLLEVNNYGAEDGVTQIETVVIIAGARVWWGPRE